MKLWKIVLVCLVAAFALGVMHGLNILRRGFSARAQPSGAETFLATSARRLALPSSYRRLRNPVPASAENLKAGMEHFADHCATCHGNDGSGDTLFGKGLYPKPPDMRKSDTQKKSDGELYYIIENGIRLSGMPAFGESSTTDDTETWKLVIFIRHLPQLTVAESQEMEQLNPKTNEERQEGKQEQDFLRGERSQSETGSRHHHH
jgi:mono/diheme cytochrome c family protein